MENKPLDKIVLSKLAHTWLIDLDGTIMKHNGYKEDGQDTLLPGAQEFLTAIPNRDTVIFLTARMEAQRAQTEAFLHAHGIFYDAILFELPTGERILINDDKPSGLAMSRAVRLQRDKGLRLRIEYNEDW